MVSAADRGEVKQGFWVAATAFITLTYDLTVRDLRTEHKNAALGILISIAQPIMAGLAYYFFMDLIGVKAGKIRGDDMTFVLMGFIMFFLHVRTVNAVGGALRPEMMYHSRLSPFLLVAVKALSSVYKIILALIVMMVLNYLLRDTFEMQEPLWFVYTFLLCWIGGIAVGVMVLALNRYLTWGSIVHSTYTRIMFLTSGKFFVANTMPAFMRPLMDWNPLFHILDQNRGAVFQNYTARTTDLLYPSLIFAGLIVLAALVGNYVRVNYSESHAAA